MWRETLEDPYSVTTQPPLIGCQPGGPAACGTTSTVANKANVGICFEVSVHEVIIEKNLSNDLHNTPTIQKKPRLIGKACLWQHFCKVILRCFLSVSRQFEIKSLVSNAKSAFSYPKNINVNFSMISELSWMITSELLYSSIELIS